ncbi:MAG: PKD domain-containing protein [Rubrimonas sp.]
MTPRPKPASRRLAGLVIVLALAPHALQLQADAQGAASPPLSVIYGPDALSREGDVDHREEIFISVPADAQGRFWVRVFDADTGGLHDTPYRRAGDTITAFRLVGGAGAWTGAPRPTRAEDGPRAPLDAAPDAPGATLAELRFGVEPAADDRWTTLAPFTAAQGEIVGGQALFRLDVIAEAGDDGNAFAIEIAGGPEGGEPPAPARMFSYRPTLRWPGGRARTEVDLSLRAGAPMTLQSFDAADGSIEIVSTFDDMRLPASGQDVWTSAPFLAPEGQTALAFSGGGETPNDVTFAIFDETGAPAPIDLPARLGVAPRRPEADAVATPLADCASVAFDASRSRGANDLIFEWRFGDGAAAAEPVTVHRYARPGTYQAELRVLEPGGRPGAGALLRTPVLVRPAPVAAPGGPITVAPGEPVAFDGTASIPSDAPIARWLWSFGDGARAQGANASHAYAAPGFYRATLRVEDDARHPCNFGVAQRDVRVNFPPIAEAGEARSAAVGETIRFAGGASYDVDGAVTGWSWEFGDGATATGATVEHAYAAPGTYVATLRVVDDAGVANSAATDTVAIVVNAPPEPVFPPQPRPLAVGEVGVFDASGSVDPDGEILSYAWDFGDGSVGEGPLVDYAWRAPGVYQVTLEVRDDSGTQSALSAFSAPVVVSAAPVADAGPDRHVTESELVFDGRGSFDPDGEITSWEWTFGDGGSASGPVVRRAYAEPGDYEVRLTVRDDSGAPLNVDESSALVRINAAPIADAGADQLVAPGQEVAFDGTGSIDPDGRVTDWLWRFGDGAEARGPRVVHSYAEPGLYAVALIVRDETGHDAAFDVDEALVRVNHPPVAAAGPDLATVPGGELSLDGRASFDPDGRVAVWRWDFSDRAEPMFGAAVSRRFEAPGVVVARLTVVDDSGALNGEASDEARIRVNAAPIAEAGPEIVTESLVVELDGGASFDPDGDRLSYLWDFGDGSPPVAGRLATHTFPRSGAFPVTLRVDDGSGMPNATAVDVTRVVIDARPIADAGGGREVCSGDQVLFDGSASRDPDGGLLRHEWDFGDGTRSPLVNPVKVYERPGVYEVTLSVRDDSGFARGVHSDRVAVVVREAPIARAAGPERICTNQQVRFDGSASTDADGSVDSFSWAFGDGTTASGAQPVKIFQRAGDYRVTLTITGDGGGTCSASGDDAFDVVVVDAPRLDVDGPRRVAAGVSATWRAALEGGVEGRAHRWSFGDGATAEGAEATHAYAEPGVYDLALESVLADDDSPCATVTTRMRVLVNAAPVAAFDAPERAAAGAPVLFDAGASADPDGGVTRYLWEFGDGATAEGLQVEHSYAAPGAYEVALTVFDDAGVANSAARAARTVAVSAAPRAGLADPGQLCPGETRLWTADAGPEGTVAWRFGDGTAVDGPEARHAFAAPGLHAVVAQLDDGLGLVTSRREESLFVRVNAAPVAQAGPDRLICPGDSVVFDASGAADPDGEIVSWVWTFDDGVVLEGPRVERSFDAAGAVGVRLDVTDDSGSACATASDAALVRVNAAPELFIGPDREVPVGGAHDWALFAAEASDPDGDGVSVEWSFGDAVRRAGAQVRHGYARPGDYLVEAVARDGSGLACGTTSATLRVAARARGQSPD